MAQDRVFDSGFYIVRDGKYYIHVATWRTYEQAVEEEKKLPRLPGEYIIIRNDDGSGAIYRSLESAY